MMKNLFFLFFVLLLSSCVKDTPDFKADLLTKQRASLPDVADLLSLISTPTDGYVVIGRLGSISKKLNREDDIQFVAEGITKNGDWADYGELSIGAYAVQAQNPSANVYYQHVGVNSVSEIYDTNLNVSLEGKEELPGFETTIETPKILNVTSPTWASNLSFGTGETITWEADENNTKGIGVLIEFDRTDIGNGQLEATSNITKFIHTEDDGSYTLTADDLSGIPTDGHAVISLARGDFKIVPMENNYQFGVFTFSTERIAFKRN